MFYDSPPANGTLNIYREPTTYYHVFYKAATTNGAKITVNYKSDVTSIDAIINTKTSGCNVVKGSVIN